MRTLTTAGFLILALTGCQPRGLSITDAVPPETSAGCDARAQSKWVVDVTQSYSVEAVASGPTCAQDVVTLVVRSQDGAPLLAWAGLTGHIFGLHDAPNPEAMKTALAGWSNQKNNSLSRTSALPEWREGRTAPGAEGDEFPFHAEDWLDRATWERMRTEDAPLFAFAQGRESLAVFLLRDGQLERIGLQQFPG